MLATPTPAFARRPRRGPGTTRAALVVLVTLALLAAGTAIAQDDPEAAWPGGGILGVHDPDVALPYSTAVSPAVCFIDLEGGGFSLGDSVVLSMQGGCSGNSGPADLRLAQWGDHPAGVRLGSAPDSNKPLQPFPAEPMYYYHDADGTGRISPGDQVYLRVLDPDRPNVQSLDVRITPTGDHPAGSRVSAHDGDIGLGLAPLGTAADRVRLVDIHGTNAFSTQDFLFLTAHPTRTLAGAGDVALYSDDGALPYGTVLGWGDPAAAGAATPLARNLCYLDQGGTGSYSRNDPLFLPLAADCTGAVAEGDLRLSTAGDDRPGRVQPGDAHIGSQYGAVGARVGTVDQDGSGGLSPGDLVVINIFSAQQNRIDAGDLLLTPTHRGAGVFLAPGDPLIDTPLTDLGDFSTLLAFPSFGGASAPAKTDPVYISPGTTTGQGLRPGDVRLVQVGDHPFGGGVDHATGELHPALTRAGATVCSTVESPSAGDPVYLRVDGPCHGTVEPGMIRLVPFGTHPAFTVVRLGDSDAGIQVGGILGPPVLKYHDAGGNNRWSPGDTLYLDIRDAGADRVDSGDVRLSPFGDLAAGAHVTGADADNGRSLRTLGSVGELVGYVDATRSNDFGHQDAAYVVPNPNTQHVSPMSVRLTPLAAAFQAPAMDDEPPDGDPVDPDPTDPDPITDPGDPTPEPTPTDTGRSPAPAPALLLIVVGALLLVAGRTRK